MMCYFAISMLEEVCKQLKEAHITVADLKKIEQNSKQMEQLLCKSGSTLRDESEEGSAGVASSDWMLGVLQERMEEYKMLQHHQGLLLNLCQHVPKIKGGYMGIYNIFCLHCSCTRTSNYINTFK